MTASATPSTDRPPGSGWTLWIDGCGGYLLLSGASWTLGSAAEPPTADIRVQADWPRHAGTIWAEGEDYFWSSGDKRRLLRSGEEVPVAGTAKLSFSRPSQLSGTAVLQLAPPHRFVGHVDGAILFRDTLLIGCTGDCHVRCHHASQALILTRRSGRWLMKLSGGEQLIELSPGVRKSFDQTAVTLEPL